VRCDAEAVGWRFAALDVELLEVDVWVVEVVVDVPVVELVGELCLPAFAPLPLPDVVDLPAFELPVDLGLPAFVFPAGPPLCLPLLFRGPVDALDFLDLPDPVCG
jgi:hypothetical protein